MMAEIHLLDKMRMQVAILNLFLSIAFPSRSLMFLCFVLGFETKSKTNGEKWNGVGGEAAGSSVLALQWGCICSHLCTHFSLKIKSTPLYKGLEKTWFSRKRVCYTCYYICLCSRTFTMHILTLEVTSIQYPVFSIIQYIISCFSGWGSSSIWNSELAQDTVPKACI